MKRFFIEIEFKAKAGNIYWIPLFLNAENKKKVIETKESLQAAFKDIYEIMRISEPTLYYKGLNSEFIDDYIKKRMKGRIETLNIDVWKIKNIDAGPNISFNERLQMIDLESVKQNKDKTIAHILSRHEFPVKVMRWNPDIDNFNEFLLINVVAS